MSIKDEIHAALAEIQQKVSAHKTLSEKEMQMLLLASLIEEEA